jgi:hypothetical protein
MKTFRYFLLLVILGSAACQSNSPEEELDTHSYNLFRAGYEPVYGEVVFTDLGVQKVGITITLQNTDARFDFPAHLHFGSITEVGELAFRLNDVDGETGISHTVLENVELSSGEVFTYAMLDEFNGSVKIHLADGVFGQFVLSYGNIGANENYLSDGVSVCTGH